MPELKRRQAHIDLIPPDHQLLPTALHCLKDNDSERPTATQLYQTLTALKRMTRYQERSQQDLHQLLREKNTQLLAKDRELDQATQDNHTLRYEVGARKEQLRRLHRQL